MRKSSGGTAVRPEGTTEATWAKLAGYAGDFRNWLGTALTCTDASGNSSTATTTVIAPRDMGKK